MEKESLFKEKGKAVEWRWNTADREIFFKKGQISFEKSLAKLIFLWYYIFCYPM